MQGSNRTSKRIHVIFYIVEEASVASVIPLHFASDISKCRDNVIEVSILIDGGDNVLKRVDLDHEGSLFLILLLFNRGSRILEYRNIVNRDPVIYPPPSSSSVQCICYFYWSQRVQTNWNWGLVIDHSFYLLYLGCLIKRSGL